MKCDKIVEQKKLKLAESYNNFPNEITLIERYVSIGGSAVDSQNKEPCDLDLIIRIGDAKKLKDFMLRNTCTELEKCNKKAHAFAEVHGPSGYRLPLYDLKMIKRRHEENAIEMSESEECQPLKPFKPMKPGIRFNNIDDALDHLFNDE